MSPWDIRGHWIWSAALALGFFLLPFSTFAATVTYASNKVMGPTTGLVGYWTMNAQDVNWTTGTVLDRSGYGNNGILTNMATRTSPAAGKLGQGLRFLSSPTVDYVNAGSAAALDDMSTFSIALWVNNTKIGAIQTLLQKADSGTPLFAQGWRLNLNVPTGVLGLEVGMSNSPIFAYSISGAVTKGWHHVVATYTGGTAYTSVAYFVDGNPVTVSSGFDGSGTRSDAIHDLTMGGYAGQTAYHFTSTLDDVRIYNRILTPAEIKQLYGVGQVKLATVPAKNPSGLVGWWTFDGPDLNWTTNTALDRSGQGNNGILTNMATRTSPVAGKLGQGLKFTGGNSALSEKIWLPNNFPDLTQRTISAWVRYASTSLSFIFQRSSFVGFYLTSGKIGFYKDFSGGDGGWNTQGGLPKNTWIHVAVSYDKSSSSNNPTFYINGIATTTVITASPTGFAQAEDLFWGPTLGRQYNGLYGLDGSLDDVRIYNRILTPTEVAQLYKTGQVTVTPFTCGVSTVKDADGNVYNTVKIGTQCWMKQNMRVGTRINIAGNQTNNGLVEKYCYSDNPANCTSNHPNQPDGGLYQWNEAMQYSTTPGARGICPLGWHIPTHDQFTTLERAVCTSGSCATDFPYDTSTTGFRGTNEGTKLKANGTSLFEGNLAGYSVSGSFLIRGSDGVFWSSSGSGGNAWLRDLVSGVAQVFRSTFDQSYGFSVRCLQN